MVEAIAVSKSFGPTVALADVSFSVGVGEIVGFLGPNGAGKTTTMRILTGFLPASGGEARIAGFDVFEHPMEVKRRVGYLPESPPLYPELTVGEYLHFVGELRGLSGRACTLRIGAVMEQTGLKGWEGRVLGSLSKGYRQRVGLAQALIHDPPVLILDEPTSGLDPTQMVGIRALIRDLATTHTVILSTHVLSEVEALCPRAVVIGRGRVLAQGTLAELKAKAKRGTWTLIEVQGIGAAALAEAEGVDQVEPIPQSLESDGWASYRVTSRGDVREALIRRVQEAKGRVRAVEARQPALEEAFVDIVGEEGVTQGRAATAGPVA
ncbi:MAG: ABC transporter ATP-binding protein [Myxococcales bacterium]|nr:ABC transporter ATP-binding protein [Myxococcales bacterium]